MSDAVSFVLPEGRLVMGSPFELQTKDHQGRPKDNPNYFIGVACPKSEPKTMEIAQQIYQVAMRDFPGNQFVAAGPFGHQTPPGQQAPFSWKIEDGDANPDKEGFAGHIIFKLTRSGSIGPCRVIDPAHNDILDHNMLRRGYYIMVAGSVRGNGQQGMQAGVYLNMDMIKLLRPGQEIFVGPSPDQLFGQPTGMPMQQGFQQPGMPMQQGFQQPGMQQAQMPGGVAQPTTPMQQPGFQQPGMVGGMQQPAGMPGALGQPMTTAPSQTGAIAQPSNPQQGFMQTPPAGTPGVAVTTGVDPNAVSGAVPGAMNPALGQMPGASPTASPSDLQQQGVQPQPGFLMPGAQG